MKTHKDGSHTSSLYQREKSLPPGSETNNNFTGTPSLSHRVHPPQGHHSVVSGAAPLPHPLVAGTLITEPQLPENKLQATN